MLVSIWKVGETTFPKGVGAQKGIMVSYEKISYY